MSSKKKILISIINFLVLPFLVVLILNISFSLINELSVILYYKGTLFSFLLIFLSFLFLLGITGKSKRAYIILFVLVFLLFIVNQIKITYVGEPLFFSDFSFVNSGGSLLKIIKGTFIQNVKPLFGMFLLCAFTFVIFYFYMILFSFDIVSIRKRIICISVSVFLFFILFFPFAGSKSFYKSLFFLKDAPNDYNSYTTYVDLYAFYGVLSGMYYQLLDSRFEVPDNYGKEKLDKILVQAKTDTTLEKIGTPNIIVILSESFFDISLLNEDITFDKDITKNFNELKEKGYLVNLISPSYGGMTANVTFELLTGGNMSYFSPGYIPFMQLFQNNTSKEIPSVVNELSNNGYYSEILMGQDSYNSEVIFKKLGFQKYSVASLNDYNKKGYYVSDDYLADLIIRHIEKNNNKDFYMVETMQSHMDYLVSKYSSYGIAITSSNLSRIDNDIMLSYAQGIYDADKMLGKVYNAIQNIDEDTIVVFFGDHLPYLKNISGENLIDKFKYFNTEDDLLNLYRLYNTQALIVSNYDMNLSIPDNLGFDLLLTKLISQMDIEISPYYNWLNSTSDILLAYNRFVTIDSDGKVYYTNKLNDKLLDMHQLRNSMMYRMFIDN